MRRTLWRLGLAAALGLLVLAIGYAGSVFWKVRETALVDEAGPADAIVVLGAAQYNGRPSPVFGARLDHAFNLFEQGYANVIITTGGYGPDPNFSEAHVGARYLASQGVDQSQLVIEQGSEKTATTVQAVARHVHAHNWERIIVVSDGFHLHRLKEMFADRGVDVLASPAPGSRIEASGPQRLWFSLREVLGIWAYRLSRFVDSGS